MTGLLDGLAREGLIQRIVDEKDKRQTQIKLTKKGQQKLDEVERILSAMAPLRRQVFLLRRIDGLSRDEIAEKLDISLEAVKKHLTRAMVELTVKLEEAGWSKDH